MEGLHEKVKIRTALLKDLLETLLQSQTFDFSSSDGVPNVKGVYLIHDKAKGLIYVGQSGRLRQRLFHDHLAGTINGSHFRKSLQAYLGTTTEQEISRYVRNQCEFQFLASEDHYRPLEHFAIAILKPVLNR